jgi:hypothetical protein
MKASASSMCPSSSAEAMTGKACAGARPPPATRRVAIFTRGPDAIVFSGHFVQYELNDLTDKLQASVWIVRS